MGEGLIQPCPKIVRGQWWLTPEQEAYMREFAHMRIAAKLSTTPIDEQEAEQYLRDAYRVAGVKPPARIRWFDSPCAFVRASVEDPVWAGVEDSVCGRVRTSVEGSLRFNVWERVKASVRTSVGSRAWENVKASILTLVAPLTMADSFMPHRVESSTESRVYHHMEDQVWKSVEASVGKRIQDRLLKRAQASVGKRVSWSVEIQVQASVSKRMSESVRAYSNAGWLAFYHFFHEVFEENRLIHLARLNEMVSGYHLGREEAWLVRKPIILEHEWGGFHNANGPCVQYRDGWGFYAWHGVRVPERVIMHPEQLTGEDWMFEPNAEVRRVIRERLSTERLIELEGVCIDRGRRGNLIRINLSLRDPEGVAHYVQVQDSSTERHYYLRVPPTITSADEAIAWTFGMDARAYQPGQET